MPEKFKCKPVLHVLRLEALPIIDQLRIEEALLRADDRNWLVLNSRVPPAIVMGISGRLDSLVDCAKVKENPIPIIRRFSGGGTVVVDEQTLFTTLICNESATGAVCFPERVHSWVEPIFRHVFLRDDFSLRENDYAFGDRKFGGNAQYLQKGRWLHHTSFLWDFDPKKMEYLLHPQKKPIYRQDRKHVDFLCCLKDYLGSPRDVEQRLIDALQERFDLMRGESEIVANICRLPHRKATKFETI